jgi:hypothetical protein
MNEQRISQALGRPINLAHESMVDILNELLTKVEYYQAEYRDTVLAVRKHLVEGQK